MPVQERVRDGLGESVVDWTEHSPRRIYITVSPQDLKDSVRLFFNDYGFRFSIATGTDTPESIELTYHFSSDETGHLFSLRVHLTDKENPRVDTISDIITGANWIEREMWELLGVDFAGHPNLKRLLLSDDWPEGNYPLRNTQEKPGKD